MATSRNVRVNHVSDLICNFSDRNPNTNVSKNSYGIETWVKSSKWYLSESTLVATEKNQKTESEFCLFGQKAKLFLFETLRLSWHTNNNENGSVFPVMKTFSCDFLSFPFSRQCVLIASSISIHFVLSARICKW